MKKLLSLFIAVLAAVGMYAQTEKTIVWTAADNWVTADDKNTVTLQVDGFSIVADKLNGTNAPTVNGTTNDLRVYAKGTLTISAPEGVEFTQVVFTVSEQGKKRLGENTVNVGTLTNDTEAGTITWNGEATNSIVITVAEKATLGTDGASKAGQFDVDSPIVITLKDVAPDAKMGQEPTDGGVYYVYNTESGTFLSRGNNYGTRAVTIPVGTPWQVSVADGKYTLCMYDLVKAGSKAGLGNNCFSDNGSPVAFTPDGTATTGYTLKSGDSYVTAPESAGDINLTSTASTWKFLSKEEYSELMQAKAASQEASVAATAGVNISGTTLSAILGNTEKWASLTTVDAIPTKSAWNVTGVPNRAGSQNEGNYGCEIYQGGGSFSKTISGLKPGIYKVKVKGLKRMSSNATCYSFGKEEGYTISDAYFTANGNVVAIADWASACTSNGAPNTTGEAKAIWDAGNGYTSEVFCYVGEDGNLSMKATSEAYWTYSWFLFGGVEYTHYTEASDLTALNEAIAEAKEKTLGFEAGEYAPYTNAEAIAALEAAKDATAYSPQEEIDALTESLNNAAWTANYEELNAVYNGDFSLTDNDGAPFGWRSSNNTLGGAYHARAMVGDDRLAVFNETKSAFYMRFDGTNSDKGTVYHYDSNSGACQMPLKAGVEYEFSLDFGGWGQQQNTRFYITDAANQTVADISQKPSAQVSGNGTPDHITAKFTPTVDGNCAIHVQNPGASANNAIVVSNIVIKQVQPAVLEVGTDYNWDHSLCTLSATPTKEGTKLYWTDKEMGEPQGWLDEESGNIVAYTPGRGEEAGTQVWQIYVYEVEVDEEYNQTIVAMGYEQVNLVAPKPVVSVDVKYSKDESQAILFAHPTTEDNEVVYAFTDAFVEEFAFEGEVPAEGYKFAWTPGMADEMGVCKWTIYVYEIDEEFNIVAQTMEEISLTKAIEPKAGDSDEDPIELADSDNSEPIAIDEVGSDKAGYTHFKYVAHTDGTFVFSCGYEIKVFDDECGMAAVEAPGARVPWAYGKEVKAGDVVTFSAYLPQTFVGPVYDEDENEIEGETELYEIDEYYFYATVIKKSEILTLEPTYVYNESKTTATVTAVPTQSEGTILYYTVDGEIAGMIEGDGALVAPTGFGENQETVDVVVMVYEVAADAELDEDTDLQDVCIASGSISITFNKPEDIATAIAGINAAANDTVYDFAGRRVSKATKGLYIVNGKKVVIK